ILSFGQHAVNEAIPGLEHVREMGLVSAIGDIIHPDHPSLPLVDYAVNSADYIRVHFPGADIYTHDRLVQQASGGVVITTDSTHPIHVVDTDGSEFLVHPPVVEHVVDTTGAGDSFKAGFMYGLTHDLPLDHCVRIGSAAGSIQVQHMGATDYLAPIEDVLALADTLRVTPL
ncbi:MAG: hypothetical protein IT326_05565, partial [Anaerolineae bacterium]|nr:hypothetical protein [Anaerolineae bacterium]